MDPSIFWFKKKEKTWFTWCMITCAIELIELKILGNICNVHRKTKDGNKMRKRTTDYFS